MGRKNPKTKQNLPISLGGPIGPIHPNAPRDQMRRKESLLRRLRGLVPDHVAPSAKLASLPIHLETSLLEEHQYTVALTHQGK